MRPGQCRLWACCCDALQQAGCKVTVAPEVSGIGVVVGSFSVPVGLGNEDGVVPSRLLQPRPATAGLQPRPAAARFACRMQPQHRGMQPQHRGMQPLQRDLLQPSCTAFCSPAVVCLLQPGQDGAACPRVAKAGIPERKAQQGVVLRGGYVKRQKSTHTYTHAHTHNTHTHVRTHRAPSSERKSLHCALRPGAGHLGVAAHLRHSPTGGVRRVNCPSGAPMARR